MTDQTPIAIETADEGPRLYGVIDVIKPERIAGWVIDRTDPDAFAEVDLLRDGLVVTTQPANRPRKDLERNSVGTGRYGFSIPLDPPLEAGMEATLSIVARSRDGVKSTLQPTARLANARVPPEQKSSDRIHEEISVLRTDLVQERARIEEMLAAQERTIAQIETVQLRLESAIARVNPPEEKSLRPVIGLAISGMAIGVVSLLVGIWSLFLK